jgi:hypothetical protein
MKPLMNPSEGTENNVVLEGIWLAYFFCDDSEGRKRLKSFQSSAQCPGKYPGEKG